MAGFAYPYIFKFVSVDDAGCSTDDLDTMYRLRVMQAHMHRHASTGTHEQTPLRARMQAHKLACMRAPHAHACVCVRVYGARCARKHTRARSIANTNGHAHVHAPGHAHAHTRITDRACAHARAKNCTCRRMRAHLAQTKEPLASMHTDLRMSTSESARMLARLSYPDTYVCKHE